MVRFYTQISSTFPRESIRVKKIKLRLKKCETNTSFSEYSHHENVYFLNNVMIKNCTYKIWKHQKKIILFKDKCYAFESPDVSKLKYVMNWREWKFCWWWVCKKNMMNEWEINTFVIINFLCDFVEEIKYKFATVRDFYMN